jgi:hypothetical protein
MLGDDPNDGGREPWDGAPTNRGMTMWIAVTVSVGRPWYSGPYPDWAALRADFPVHDVQESEPKGGEYVFITGAGRDPGQFFCWRIPVLHTTRMAELVAELLAEHLHPLADVRARAERELGIAWAEVRRLEEQVAGYEDEVAHLRQQVGALGEELTEARYRVEVP